MRLTPRTAARALFPAALLAAIGSAPGAAQIALGPEFQVNVWTTNAQGAAGVAAGPAGDFVVAWGSYNQGMPGCYGYQGSLCSGVFARRLDTAGRPAGGEIQVHDSTAVSLNVSGVASAPSGGFVVVWDTTVPFFRPGRIQGRRFDSQGAALGPSFPVSTTLGEDLVDAAVATDASGAFSVVWWRSELPQSSIFGRRFDPQGSPLSDEFPVHAPTTNSNTAPDLAMAPSGEFVVSWSQHEPTDARRVVSQRYDAAGEPLGGITVVSESGAAGFPALASVPGGGFVVAWHREVGTDLDVYARRYDAGGAPLGGEFRVNSYTTGRQRLPDVAADATGNLLVTWTSDGQDGSGAGVFARRFDATGVPFETDVQVNSHTTGDQGWPVVAATPAGDFLVAWSSNEQDGSYWGVFARMIRVALFADGFEAGDACRWSDAVGGGCP